MSEVAPAKVRVEVFPQVGFWDDHFCVGWTKISGGTSTFATDGDVATLDRGNQTYGEAEHALNSLRTGSGYYTKIQVRVTRTTGTWSLKVRSTADYYFSIYTDEDGTGLFEASLPGSQYLEAVILYAMVGETDFEYVAITKVAMVIPDLGDLVEEMAVTRPTLNNGIAGARFSVPNFAGAYNGLISEHDVVLIWITRDDADLGVPHHKMFGGRVAAVSSRGEDYGKFFIDLDCHSHAYELSKPPALLQAYYAAVNGRTILENAMALCAYLVKHPTPNFWFDNSGSSGSTDDRIDSTHDVSYDEVVPFDVLKEILEKAKNPSAVQGFDAYETAAGCVVGHLRNSLDFKWTYNTLYPRPYERTMDLHPVINVQKVYGAFDAGLTRPFPVDENWTETLPNWTCTYGSLSLDDSNKHNGSYALQVVADGAYKMGLKRSFLPEFAFISGRSKARKNSFSPIKLWYFLDGITPPGTMIFYMKTDDSNYFSKTIAPTSLAWTLWSSELAADDANWTKTGTPTWDNITSFEIYCPAGYAMTLWVDGLELLGGRFFDEAEDSTSQDKYGVRVGESIIEDSLNSDAECLALAESVIATSKDPIVTLSKDVTVDGDYWFDPGILARVIVANDGLDAWYRVVQLMHRVRQTVWDTVLTLSNEPQKIDLVFRLLQDAQKLLGKKP